MSSSESGGESEEVSEPSPIKQPQKQVRTLNPSDASSKNKKRKVEEAKSDVKVKNEPENETKHPQSLNAKKKQKANPHPQESKQGESKQGEAKQEAKQGEAKPNRPANNQLNASGNLVSQLLKFRRTTSTKGGVVSFDFSNLEGVQVYEAFKSGGCTFLVVGVPSEEVTMSQLVKGNKVGMFFGYELPKGEE